MPRITRAATLLFFVVLTPAVALAQSAPVCDPTAGKGGILTGLATQFSTTTGPWTSTALRYAQDLFFALVAIEIAWSAITYVLQKDSLPDFVASLLLKIISVGFFYTLLQPEYGPVWISDIVSSFSQAGSAIGGQGQFLPSDPSSVFNCGTDVANAMLQSVSNNNTGINLGNFLPAIEAIFAALICALGVVLAFAIVAGQLLITLIESYIVIGAGVFMLGFTGSRWTLVFGEKYVGYAFSVGIKLFMLELIVGLGYALGQQWAALFANGIAPPETYIEVVGAALIFGFVAWQIPGLAASLMNGSPRMTLGSFLNTAGTVAVGGVVVGSGVGGMIAGMRGSSAATNTDALRSATQASDGGNIRALTTTAARSNGSTSDYSTRADDAGAQRWAYDSDFGSPSASSQYESPADDADVASASAASGQNGELQTASPETESSVNEAGEPIDSTDADVTAEDVAQTRVTDAEIAAEDARAAQEAEQRDVQSGAAQSATPGTTPGINPLQALRQPPIPDDSADGSVEIRFKHPE
ncbi:MAG: P-type conjugative transfer protein TrbL [Candidatus Tyrphobacter sp.]